LITPFDREALLRNTKRWRDAWWARRSGWWRPSPSARSPPRDSVARNDFRSWTP